MPQLGVGNQAHPQDWDMASCSRKYRYYINSLVTIVVVIANRDASSIWVRAGGGFVRATTVSPASPDDPGGVPSMVGGSVVFDARVLMCKLARGLVYITKSNATKMAVRLVEDFTGRLIFRCRVWLIRQTIWDKPGPCIWRSSFWGAF